MQHVTCNFNLRNRRSNKPSIIYMVVYADGRQYKISTGIKLLPSQWDFKKQTPKVSGMFSEEANRHGIETLTFLNSLKFCFEEYCIYICTSKNIFNINNLKENIMNNTNLVNKASGVKNTTAATKVPSRNFQESKRTPQATKKLKWAIDKYVSDREVVKSTIDVYNSMYKSWTRWITETNQTDSMKLCSREGVNNYKEYLKGKKITPTTINSQLSVLISVINKKLVSQGKWELTPIVYDPVKKVTVKPDESKHVELTDEEIETLSKLTLDGAEEIARNFFLLQLECGQRASDAWNLIHGEGIKNETEKKIVLRTKKRKKKSYITKTQEFDRLRKWFANNLPSGRYATFVNKVNRKLKAISKKNGLNRIIEYVDTLNGNEQSAPLYELITTHYARHTFATKMARKYDAETVAYMIGDSVKTVKDVYYHETDEDVTNKIDKAKEKAEATPTPTQAVSNEAEYIESEIRDLINALVMVGVPYEDLDGKDLTELWRMMVNKENELLKLGVDPRRVKDIHKIKDKNLKEKKAILQDVIEKAKVNKS